MDGAQSEPPVSLLPVVAVAERQAVPSQKMAPQLVPQETLQPVLAGLVQALESLRA